MSSVIEDLAALPRFLTVKETCAFLGVSASTVKRFVKSGDLRQWTPERGHRKIIRGRPREDPHGIRRLIFPTNMSHHGKEAQKRG